MCARLGASYRIPADPLLAAWAVTTRDSGQWAEVVDRQWRLVYVTDELRRTLGADELAEFAIGEHYFGPEAKLAAQRHRYGFTRPELRRRLFVGLGGLVLTDHGGVDEVRAAVDPTLIDLVDGLAPIDDAVVGFEAHGIGLQNRLLGGHITAVRARDVDGRLAGTVLLRKPAPGMATIGAMTSHGDLGHFARMQQVAAPSSRPAALFFADLEGSSQLARRLTTADYFALARRLVRRADQCVVDAGGLVGRHVGDGMVAFFLAQSAGSESAAARACITTARSLRAAMPEIAARSNLRAEDVTLRFGLHWGATPYVGSIISTGRAEVTALGDEVNEAARIEACATGGRTLASKNLLERLTPTDLAALGPADLRYTVLAELPTATAKARRDAPALAVCEI